MKSILLRYGEINLKGKNRQFFERALMTGVKKKIKDEPVKIFKLRNRIIIDFNEEEVDTEKLYNTFLKLPGIENISLATKTKSDYLSIKKSVLEVFDKTKPCFRISTKRSDKTFEYTSQEFSRLMGGEVLKANDGMKGLGVSMKDFDQEIGIEILRDFSYVFHKKTTAMGGLPIGSGGRGIVLLSGGIDSPVAAIEAMKRGIKVDCAHFYTPPYTTKEALNKVKQLVGILKQYDEDIKLFNFNITDMQIEIKDKCKDRFTLLLMRRMMYRKVSKFGLDYKYQMVITGESIGQVASQTIESMTVTNMVSLLPVIRPLVTHNKNDIIIKGKKYGTYEISIIPFEDACTVFAPRSPETKPKIEDILYEETKFDVNHWIDKIEVSQEHKKNINIENYM